MTQKNAKKAETNKFWKTVAIVETILIVGVLVMLMFESTAPKAKKRSRPVMQTSVVTTKVYQTTEPVSLGVWGTVIPEKEVELKSRVSGEILFISDSLLEGNFVKKGDLLLEIDPKDYELGVLIAESDLANAQSDFEQEMGNQRVAQREWDIVGKDSTLSDANKDLALRKPHLMKAKANVRMAEAKLEKAKLDLSRTKIFAPFDAFVLAKHIEVGAYAGNNSLLCELVGTEHFHVQVSVPSDSIHWIDLESGNSTAKLFIDSSAEAMDAEIVSLLPDLSEKGRMARLLVSVTDPFGLESKKRGPLLIGSYVKVQLLGKELEDVYMIPRGALQQGDQVWVADEENRLQIKDVSVIWKNKTHAYLENGIEADSTIILSSINMPVVGMPLKLVDRDSLSVMEKVSSEKLSAEKAEAAKKTSKEK